MRNRAIPLVSLGLALGIAALVLHLLAMCSSNWKITKREREPRMAQVSYGIWQRCEDANVTINKQGIALGMRPVQLCRPNRFMRYSPANFDACYHIRRQCPVMQPAALPAGCSCRYLPSDRALQWLTVLAAIFLTIGLLLLYLKAISEADNKSAAVVLSFGPLVSLALALLLMIVTLILVGAYLRRDVYEDYSFPLPKVKTDSDHGRVFDLHSLRNYVKLHHATFDRQSSLEAEKDFRQESNDHYKTKIGWATGYEIIATVLVLIATGVTFLLGTGSRSAEI